MSVSMSDVSVVFAGGQSRRMGQNKLLLPRCPGDLDTVLTHVIKVASAVAHTVVVLASSTADRQFETVIESFPNAHWIRDEIAYDGPLQALGHAFAEGEMFSSSIWTFIAGDLPGIDKRVLNSCFERLHQSEHVDAALVVREQRWQPLLGCYRGQAIRKVVAQANQGERRFMSILELLTITELKQEDFSWPEWWTRPIHTLEDYHVWCEWIHKQSNSDQSM